MSVYGDRAEAMFRQGYNCSQAVLCAFGNLTGLEDETAAKLASSFGGGFGRMREVCGAVSGAGMVLGLLRGYSDPDDQPAKRAHYSLVQQFANGFKAQNGSIICRELLSGVGATEGGSPDERNDSFYKKRPCAELVREAAELTAELLGVGEA